jgi:hypothetical protein
MKERIQHLLERDFCPELGIRRPTPHAVGMAEWLLPDAEAIAPDYTMGEINGAIHVHWIGDGRELTLVAGADSLSNTYIYYENNATHGYGIYGNATPHGLAKWLKWLIGEGEQPTAK